MAETTLTGLTFGVDPAFAADAYEKAFADVGVSLAARPEMTEAADGHEVSLTIEVNDLDQAFWAVSRAQDRLRTHAVNNVSDMDEAARLVEQIERSEPQQERQQERETIVVNMFGGPGAGKSTAALEVAASLKKAGYVVEYAAEYAKDLVWDMNDPAATQAERLAAADMLSGQYDSQLAVYKEQLHRIQRCLGQCDFVVTDSPILLSAAYLKESTPAQREWFEDMAFSDFDSMRNFNMFVERGRRYEREGRVHSEKEARNIDSYVKDMLDANDIYYGTYDHDQIDQAIKNMQATRNRVLRVKAIQDETRENLRKTTEGIEPDKEAGSRDRGQSPQRGALVDMAEQEKQMEYEHVSFPKQGYQGRNLIRPFKGRDGQDWVQIKFPPHTPPMLNSEGVETDFSNRTILVPGGESRPVQASTGGLGIRTGSVTAWENDPNYVDVSFPKTNREGQPWNLEARLSQGHWENPAGQGADRGAWIDDEPLVDRVDVNTVADAMDYYRADRRDYAREQQERQQSREQEQARDVKAQDAKPAPERRQEESKAAPTKPKPSRATPGPSSKAAATPEADAKAAVAAAKAQAQAGRSNPARTQSK